MIATLLHKPNVWCELHGVSPKRITDEQLNQLDLSRWRVAYTGAEPIFVDCDPMTGNIDPTLLADLLGRLRREGRPIGAVIRSLGDRTVRRWAMGVRNAPP